MSHLSPEELATMSYFDSEVERLLNPYSNLDLLSAAAYASYENYRDEEILRFLGQLEGRNVLALGCGTAIEAALLKEQGASYVGIDISEKVLEAALLRDPTLAVARMNMRFLGFADNSFDGVWLFDSFQNIPKRDVPQLLGEISRVTKPNGVVYISAIPGQDTGQLTVLGGVARPFEQFWQPETLRTVVDEAGFNIFDLNYDPATNPYLTLMLSPNK